MTWLDRGHAESKPGLPTMAVKVSSMDLDFSCSRSFDHLVEQAMRSPASRSTVIVSSASAEHSETGMPTQHLVHV